MKNNYLLCECECSFIEELGWMDADMRCQEAFDFFKEHFPEELCEIWFTLNDDELEDDEELDESARFNEEEWSDEEVIIEGKKWLRTRFNKETGNDEVVIIEGEKRLRGRFNPEAWSNFMYDEEGIKYAVIGDGEGSGTCYYVQVSSNNVKDKIENLLELEKEYGEFYDTMYKIAENIENDIEDIDESDLTVLSDSEVELLQNPDRMPLFKGRKPDAIDSEETSRGNNVFEALRGTSLNMIDVETADKVALAAGYKYKYSDNGINYYWE